MRWRRRRYIDWDAWEPKQPPKIDWATHRVGDRLPRMPLWVFADVRGRPLMEPEEYAAMPWWDRFRWCYTYWDPRDRSKFDPLPRAQPSQQARALLRS
jgi:hypothetical protein